MWDSILKEVGSENSFSKATGNQLNLLLVVQSGSGNLGLKWLFLAKVTAHLTGSQNSQLKAAYLKLLR